MAVHTEETWLIEDRDGDTLKVEWESAEPAKVRVTIPYEVDALVFDEGELETLIKTLSTILDTKVRVQN